MEPTKPDRGEPDEQNDPVGRETLPIPDHPQVGVVTDDAKDPATSYARIEPPRRRGGRGHTIVGVGIAVIIVLLASQLQQRTAKAALQPPVHQGQAGEPPRAWH